jgi:hypothetical protein
MRARCKNNFPFILQRLANKYGMIIFPLAPELIPALMRKIPYTIRFYATFYLGFHFAFLQPIGESERQIYLP